MPISEEKSPNICTDNFAPGNFLPDALMKRLNYEKHKDELEYYAKRREDRNIEKVNHFYKKPINRENQPNTCFAIPNYKGFFAQDEPTKSVRNSPNENQKDPIVRQNNNFFTNNNGQNQINISHDKNINNQENNTKNQERQNTKKSQDKNKRSPRKIITRNMVKGPKKR